jgi:hypothetical protein
MNNRITEESNIFNQYKVVAEAAKTQVDPKAKFGTKPGKPATDLPDHNDPIPAKPFVQDDSGPAEADNFKKDIVDPKTIKPGKSVYEPEKFSNTIGKSVKESINNFMNSKSVFDKLYEQVMGEGDLDQLDAQQLGVGPEVGAEGEMGAEVGGEEVTLTLSREDAEKLHGILASALEAAGGEEEGAGEEGAGEGEGESEDAGSEDNQEPALGEGIEAQEIGHALVGSGVKGGAPTPVTGSSNVVKGTVTGGAKAGKAGDGKVTDKVGNDGEKGHALVGSGVAGGAPTSVKGKANVVNSRIKGNNQDAFSV